MTPEPHEIEVLRKRDPKTLTPKERESLRFGLDYTSIKELGLESG